ncbi:hypothetical protein Taro_023211 [Colocasia esculenta]|uniref:Protein FAR1-RELATED SEQUENCE n=1 Tax=Colocasia esculenta TaxID=4460 RepID=A0A843VAQ1_COLES|nr:hypothetical protein [Colocasia esculenta]
MQKEYTVNCQKQEKKVECSCKSFEFKGFLCRHALLALQYVGIDGIPKKYFLQRWCKDMRYRHAYESFDVQKEDKKCSSSRYTNLIFRFMKVAEAASCSEEAYDIAVAEIQKILGKVIESMNGLSMQSNTRIYSTSNCHVQDPPKASTKGRKREKQISSALEKIRKRSKASKKCIQTPTAVNYDQVENETYIAEASIAEASGCATRGVARSGNGSRGKWEQKDYLSRTVKGGAAKAPKPLEQISRTRFAENVDGEGGRAEGGDDV